MSKQKKGKKTSLADLEVVPYEKSIPYYLEQNRDELIRREVSSTGRSKKNLGDF